MKGWLHTPQISKTGASTSDVVYCHTQDLGINRYHHDNQNIQLVIKLLSVSVWFHVKFVQQNVTDIPLAFIIFPRKQLMTLLDSLPSYRYTVFHWTPAVRRSMTFMQYCLWIYTRNEPLQKAWTACFRKADRHQVDRTTKKNSM